MNNHPSYTLAPNRAKRTFKVLGIVSWVWGNTLSDASIMQRRKSEALEQHYNKRGILSLHKGYLLPPGHYH